MRKSVPPAVSVDEDERALNEELSWVEEGADVPRWLGWAVLAGALVVATCMYLLFSPVSPPGPGGPLVPPSPYGSPVWSPAGEQSIYNRVPDPGVRPCCLSGTLGP